MENSLLRSSKKIPRRTPAWLAQVRGDLTWQDPEVCFNAGGGKSSRPSRRGGGGGYQAIARVEKRIRSDCLKFLNVWMS